MLGAIGAWLGWAALPFVVLGASGAGIVWVLSIMVRGGHVEASDRIPLGTLLAISAFVVWGVSIRTVFY